MSYLALARKWRPKVFAEVIGQAHVVSALTNALNNQRVHHAFLFSGTRGVGKTTLARIFAKALNCQSGVSAEPCGECITCQGIDQGNLIDLIEVDAASRTKVEDTRELLDNVQYTPTQGRFKIYLIDEVHMLSTHSFNALLKTLEEPPEHVKFLLATTNPQKLPTTILSRCIQFNLKSVDIAHLSAHLENILAAEQIEFEPQALLPLAKSANGSVRDSLSLLDQAIAFSNNNITAEQTRAMLGMIDDQLIQQLLERILAGDADGIFTAIDRMAEKSADYAAAVDELMSLIHNVSLFQFSPDSLQWKGVDTEPIGQFAERVEADELQLLYQIALLGKRDFDYAPDPRSGFEMTLMRMLAFQPQKTADRHPPSRSSPKTDRTTAARPDSPAPSAPPAPPATEQSTKPPAQSPETRQETRQPAEPQPAEPQPKQDKTPQTTPVSMQNLDLQDIKTPLGWKNFIDQAGFVGVSRELLMNMLPQSVDGDTVTLALDSSRRVLHNADRMRKIEERCREHLFLDIRFEVEIEELSQFSAENETPVHQIERQQQQEQDALQQTFIEDPNVQKIVDTFDAEINSDSIRRVKQ